MTTNDKPAILQALRAFVQERPGFDPANYGFDAAGRRRRMARRELGRLLARWFW